MGVGKRPMLTVRKHIEYRLHGVRDRRGRITVADSMGTRQATPHASQSSGWSRRRKDSSQFVALDTKAGRPGQTHVQEVQHGVRAGRDKDRIRHPWRRRPSVRELNEGEGMKVGILNMLGWNWSSRDVRHEEKSHELLHIMRNRRMDIMLLADLHHPAEERRWHSRNVNVGIEEFLLVVGDRTAILLSPRVQIAWQKTGCFCSTETTGRASMIEIEVAKTRYHVAATYIPDVSKGAEVRRDTWKSLGEWREDLSLQRQKPGYRLLQMWGGDWNSHMGRDAHERTPDQIGTYGSLHPTSQGGRQMQQWLATEAVELQLADSYRPVKHRGTYQHRTSKVWHDLDTLVVSPALLPRVNSIQQFDTAVSDHRGKVYHICLACDQSHALRELKKQAKDDLKLPLALHRMRGKTKEAHQAREEFREEIKAVTSLWPDVGEKGRAGFGPTHHMPAPMVSGGSPEDVFHQGAAPDCAVPPRGRPR